MAQYTDMLLHKEYKDLLESEKLRQIKINALAVVETNKHSKAKQFKDIEMFQDALDMFDYIMNEYIEDAPVSHATERQKLFGFRG